MRQSPNIFGHMSQVYSPQAGMALHDLGRLDMLQLRMGTRMDSGQCQFSLLVRGKVCKGHGESQAITACWRIQELFTRLTSDPSTVGEDLARTSTASVGSRGRLHLDQLDAEASD